MKRCAEEQLPCELTDHEITEKARELVDTQRNARDMKARRKSDMSAAKVRIDAAEQKAEELEETVKSGTEARVVACYLRPNVEATRLSPRRTARRTWTTCRESLPPARLRDRDPRRTAGPLIGLSPTHERALGLRIGGVVLRESWL
jgi:hypothetical protein